MKIDWNERTIRLGVGELANFQDGPSPGVPDLPLGRWRLESGRIWHEELRRQKESSPGPSVSFEVPVEGILTRRNWSFIISGRVDQVVHSRDGEILVEVKSVTNWCSDPSLWRQTYPTYFTQIALYLRIWTANSPPTVKVSGEIHFVDIADGQQARVPIEGGDHTSVDEQIERVLRFVERRQKGVQRLRQLRFDPPFPSWRPGQEKAWEELQAGLSDQRRVLLAAPTGFGKSGLALLAALGALRNGAATRVLFLSGKGTGQATARTHLDEMLGHPPDAWVWQVRNKSEHCLREPRLHCHPEACTYLEGLAERWHSSGASLAQQEPGYGTDLESLKFLGEHIRICPYEMTRASLPWYDIWIGDYNYIFSPGSKHFFGNQPGFDPAQTWMIIDEVHNLPGRVAEAYSSAISSLAVRQLLADLEFGGAHYRLAQSVEDFLLWLDQLTPTDNGPSSLAHELQELCGNIATRVRSHPLATSGWQPDTMEMLWNLCNWAEAAWPGPAEMPFLYWVPEPGLLRVDCLEAAPAIREALHPFQKVLFLTATPGPEGMLAEACGWSSPDLHVVRARASWRNQAYDVVLDGRVDTRYRNRSRSYATTAATLLELLDVAGPPLIAFFPSYAYRRAVAGQLEHMSAWVRVALPEGRDLSNLESILLGHEVVLFVVGTGFSESIDLLGGRAAACLIAGPCLPEVNAVQKARHECFASRDAKSAFARTYLYPGMQKVNQALGRLVRQPDQKVRVVLHCQRFLHPEYHQLLQEEYLGFSLVTNQEEWNHWLNSISG